ncbi:MAG: four-carbon acid sugar kinase family protein, partial [Candidatus Dormibacteraceae bacterium]
MNAARAFRLGLIGDDLTGACDSAAPFLGAGPVAVGLWPEVPPGERSAVSTETRDADPEEAGPRTAVAARHYTGRLLYRKLDSMLRGNPRADVAALVELGARVVVAPALPQEGRVTQEGVQRWRGGEVDLRALFEPLGEHVTIADASTDADLGAVAWEILDSGAVAAGSAGLASALACALGLPPAPRTRAPGCRR